MRFYTQQHAFYCGVDLHAKTMHVCIVHQAGETLVHRNLPTRPDLFLNAIGLYRQYKQPSARGSTLDRCLAPQVGLRPTSAGADGRNPHEVTRVAKSGSCDLNRSRKDE